MKLPGSTETDSSRIQERSNSRGTSSIIVSRLIIDDTFTTLE